MHNTCFVIHKIYLHAIKITEKINGRHIHYYKDNEQLINMQTKFNHTFKTNSQKNQNIYLCLIIHPIF